MHMRVKMKPVDVKSSTYIDSGKEVNDKDHKLQENTFTKGYTTNRSEEVFVIKKNLKYRAVDICY